MTGRSSPATADFSDAFSASSKRLPSSTKAFFLQAEQGQRYCVYFRASTECRPLGSLLYLHPFAEEMNKSRRMAALQARALAAVGYNVLLMDLYGCGDSSGDINDARWPLWKSDAVLAINWLREQSDAPVSLWGLRLGALLALDVCRTSMLPIANVLIWQPVFAGKPYLTQFYRLLLAGHLLGADLDTQLEVKSAMTSEPNHTGNSPGKSTQQVRQAFLNGDSVEIAGYLLHPELVNAIDNLEVSLWDLSAQKICWLECVNDMDKKLPPPRQHLLDQWQDAGVNVQLNKVMCPHFWATQDIATSDALIQASAKLLTETPPL